MIAFHNDMTIPIFHFLNQKFNENLNKNNFLFNSNEKLSFYDVNSDEFPIYNFFKNMDKTVPANLIKFNVANEFAVNSFKKGYIKYTDICNLVEKISSLNLNYKLKTIKDIIHYHELLEIKLYEKFQYL